MNMSSRDKKRNSKTHLRTDEDLAKKHSHRWKTVKEPTTLVKTILTGGIYFFSWLFLVEQRPLVFLSSSAAP
jgi:hypothetical protein